MKLNCRGVAQDNRTLNVHSKIQKALASTPEVQGKKR